jgi:hypothetical protein
MEGIVMDPMTAERHQRCVDLRAAIEQALCEPAGGTFGEGRSGPYRVTVERATGLAQVLRDVSPGVVGAKAIVKVEPRLQWEEVVQLAAELEQAMQARPSVDAVYRVATPGAHSAPTQSDVLVVDGPVQIVKR